MTEISEAYRLHKVSFPREINSKEVANLLQYVAEKGNYSDLDYSLHSQGKISVRNGERTHSTYVGKIEGQVWRGLTSGIFNLEKSLGEELDEGSFRGISFSPFGRDFDEIEPEELQIWKDFGKYIDQYFKKKDEPEKS